MSVRFFRSSAVLSVSSMIASVCAGAANAQSSGAQLEEVVVTAERRETDLQETPISIVSLNSEQIAATGSRDLRELSQFVPNLSVQPAQFYGSAAPSINIRGIGAGAGFGIAEDRSVGLYIDGVFYPRVPGSLLSTADVDSVEVLRGPQGTLFGRNTTGGAISYHSVRPSLDGFAGYVDVQVGTYEERNVSAAVNVPLSDAWAMRAQVSDLNREGYVKRGRVDMGNIDDTVGRVSFRGLPTDRVTMDIDLSYTKAHSNGEPQVVRAFKVDSDKHLERYFGALSLLLEQVPVSQGGGALVTNDPRLLMGGYRAPAYCVLDDKNPMTMGPKGGLCDNYRDSDLAAASFKVAYKLSDHLEFSSLTGVLDGSHSARSDAIWSGTYARDFDQDFQSFQQEVQLTWSSDKWNAVGGLIYFTEDANEKEYTTEQVLASYTSAAARNRVLTGTNIERRVETYAMTTKSAALFGQATYSVTDKLDVTLGLRRTQDKKEAQIHLIPTVDDIRNRMGTGEKSWGATDYRVALNYKVIDDVMVYASRSKAYKAGIYNDSSIEIGAVKATPEIMPVAFIQPEELVSNEVGLRSEWWDRRLRFNLSFYDQEWTNRQNQRGIVDVASGITVIITENQPDVSSKGAELDFMLAVTDSLTLSGALGTIKAEQKNNPGFILEGVPERTWQLGIEHRWDVPWGGAIKSSLNYAWRGAVYSTNTQAVDATGPASTEFNPDYDLLNGRVTYTPDSKKWSAALYAQNILDKYYTYSRFGSTGGFHTGTGNGSAIAASYPGMPRMVGVQLRYNF